MTTTTNTHQMPTDPIILKKLKDCIQEMSDSMTRIASERDFIKEAIKANSEELQIDKKVIRSLAKVYFKDEMRKKIGETDDLAALYSVVFKVNLDDNSPADDEDED